MANEKKEERGFHFENTVEIEINGVKRRVNKFEAGKLVKKLNPKK